MRNSRVVADAQTVLLARIIGNTEKLNEAMLELNRALACVRHQSGMSDGAARSACTTATSRRLRPSGRTTPATSAVRGSSQIEVF